MILIIFFYSKQSAQYKNRAIKVILLSPQSFMSVLDNLQLEMN